MERRRRRRRRSSRTKDVAFRPYTRPKSYRPQAAWRTSLGRFAFNLRVQWSWLRRRLSRRLFQPSRRSNRSRRARTSSAISVRRSRRRSNWGFLINSLVAVLVVGGGTEAWRRYSVGRTSQSLVSAIAADEQAGRHLDAAKNCYRYLLLRPRDPAMRLRLASNIDQGAKQPRLKQRAIELYLEALRDVEDPQVRRRLATLLLELKQYHRAALQGEILLQVDADDPVAARVQALALLGQLDQDVSAPPSSVVDAVRRAVTLNPTDVELAVSLADIYRTKSPTTSADEAAELANDVLDVLVQQAPENPAALLARYEYRNRFGIPGADLDLDQALGLAPDNFNVLCAVTDRALTNRLWADAQATAEQAIALSLRDPRGYALLGQAQFAAGEHDAAIETWRRGLREAGAQDFSLHLHLAQALTELDRVDEANSEFHFLEQVLAELPASAPGRGSGELERSFLYLRAGWHLRQREFEAALKLTQQLLSLDASPSSPIGRFAPVTTLQAQTLLLACYEGLERWDLAAAAAAKLVQLEPQLPAHYLHAADIFERLGRLDSAESLLERVTRLPEFPGQAWQQFARIRLARQMALPPAQRVWTGMEEVSQRAHADNQAPWVLEGEVEYFLQTQQLTRALERLRQVTQSPPTSVEEASRWAMLWDRVGKAQEADRVLEAYEKSTGDRTSVQPLRVETLARRGEFARASEILLAELPAATPEARPNLLRQLAELQFELGHIEQAQSHLAELAQADTPEPQWICLLIEIALATKDQDSATRWLTYLEEHHSDANLHSRYFRARQLLETCGGPEGTNYEAFATFRDGLLAQHPRAPEGHLLTALAADRFGWPELACQEYALASESHTAPLETTWNLLARLHLQGRLLQAHEVLERWVVEAQQPRSAVSIARRVRHRVNHWLAQRALDREPENPVAHWQRGIVDLILQEPRKALDHLRHAADAQPSDPLSHSLQLSAALLAAQQDVAARALDALVHAPPGDAPLSHVRRVPQAWQLLERPERARAAYQQALDQFPEDPVLLETGARFLASSAPRQAEQLLARFFAPRESISGPLGALAQTLARHADDPRWRNAWHAAIRLHHTSQQAHPGTLAEACRLIRHGGQQAQDFAIRLLEQEASSDPTPYALLLASLYEAAGRLNDARECLQRSLLQESSDPQCLAALVALLLKHNYPADATSHLDRLETTHADDEITLLLRTRWYKLLSRTRDATAAIKAFADASSGSRAAAERASHLVAAAQSAVVLADSASAERYFKQALELDTDALLPYAYWLAEQGRADDLLAIATAADKKHPSARIVLLLSRQLPQFEPLPRRVTSLTPLVARAETTYAADPTTQAAVARLWDWQGRTAPAIEHLREQLQRFPEHAGLRTQLAWLLARELETAAEARHWIETSPIALDTDVELRATHAMVLARCGAPEQAIEILEDLAARGADDPTYLLHLARAYHQLGKNKEARRSLFRAKQRGANGRKLLPHELDLLAKLEADLGA